VLRTVQVTLEIVTFPTEDVPKSKVGPGCVPPNTISNAAVLLLARSQETANIWEAVLPAGVTVTSGAVVLDVPYTVKFVLVRATKALPVALGRTKICPVPLVDPSGPANNPRAEVLPEQEKVKQRNS
jgi:hypothetical protein